MARQNASAIEEKRALVIKPAMSDHIRHRRDIEQRNAAVRIKEAGEPAHQDRSPSDETRTSAAAAIDRRWREERLRSGPERVGGVARPWNIHRPSTYSDRRKLRNTGFPFFRQRLKDPGRGRRTMRILMMAAIDASVPNACISHLDGVAAGFVSHGHDVILALPDTGGAAPQFEPHTGGYKARYVCFGRQIGVPRAITFILYVIVLWKDWHAADLIYIRSHIFSGVFVQTVRLLAPSARVVTEHNSFQAEDARLNGWPRIVTAVAGVLQIREAKTSSQARCVTEGVARRLAAHGVPPDKMFVVGNGTDPKRFHPIARADAMAALDLDPDCFYIGFIGSLAPWHGVSYAIAGLPKVIAAHRHARLLIAGDGIERAALERQVTDLTLTDAVRFLGPVSQKDANSAINAFDLAIAPFPSARNESIGMSPLKIRDYAAGGRAILSTDVDGVRDSRGGDWIAIAPPNDADAFANAIIALIDDQRRRKALGAAARAHAEAHFAWTVLSGYILNAVQDD